MGKIAEYIVNGQMCECCGGCIGDSESPGFPRCCDLDCAKDMGYKHPVRLGGGIIGGRIMGTK